MKIPKLINNRYVKQTLLFSTLSAAVILANKSCNEIIVNNIGKEVLVKDSMRYKRVLNDTKNMNIISQKQIWAKEKALMDDSIRLDSVSKKAYLEGAQMVRDSINNINK